MIDFESAKASLYQAMMKKPLSQEDSGKLIKALDDMYKVAGAK